MISRSFLRSFKKVTGIEGGFSDHPQDTGGKTRFGITEKLAREYGYKGKMEDLPVETAKDIYFKEFWEKNNLTGIAGINEGVAFEVFDTSINCGSEVAVKFLQRALNVFNDDEELYKDLKIDGKLGDKTIEAFTKFHSHRGKAGTDVILKALNGQQASYYIRISEKNPQYQTFTYGWISHRA